MYKKSLSLISFVLLLVMASAGSTATYYVDFDGSTITVGDWAGFDYLKYKAGFDYGAADALPSGSTRTDTGQVIIDIAAQEP